MGIAAAFAVPHPPLILDSVGQGRERAIQKTIDAYDEIGRRIAEIAPDTVVISSPHATMYRDWFQVSPGPGATGSLSSFGAPEARFRIAYDETFASTLSRYAAEHGLPAGTDHEREPALDHATMVPIHFIERHLAERPQYVRIGLSGLSPADHYRLGQAIQAVAEELGRRVVFVASGDLSHKLAEDGPYGFAPEGPRFDEDICRIFRTGGFLGLLAMDRGFADRAAECGLRSFQIMAGALDGLDVRPELLSYEGPFGVGYAVAAFTPLSSVPDGSRRFLEPYRRLHDEEIAKRRAHEDAYVRLARDAMERWVCRREIMPLPDGLGGELSGRRAGCFVSLKTYGELRGCIGTIFPSEPSLAEEIVSNAIAASSRDPRFPPVRPDELDDIVCTVDVLGEPEPISGIDELDPARYGAIVSTEDGRRGLLLPDLDGVDTAEQQVAIAARKGGIDLGHDQVRIERFEVVRHR